MRQDRQHVERKKGKLDELPARRAEREGAMKELQERQAAEQAAARAAADAEVLTETEEDPHLARLELIDMKPDDVDYWPKYENYIER